MLCEDASKKSESMRLMDQFVFKYELISTAFKHQGPNLPDVLSVIN